MPALRRSYSPVDLCPVTPAQILAAERIEAIQQAADLRQSLDAIIEASEDVALDDEHDPDGSTVGYERAQVTSSVEDQAEQRSR